MSVISPIRNEVKLLHDALANTTDAGARLVRDRLGLVHDHLAAVECRVVTITVAFADRLVAGDPVTDAEKAELKLAADQARHLKAILEQAAAASPEKG